MKKKRKSNTYDDMLSAVRYELKQKYRKYTIESTLVLFLVLMSRA